MPASAAPGPGGALSRRTAITLLLGAAATACTPVGGGRDAQGPRPREPEVDPDVTLAAAALALHQDAWQRVQDTARRHPSLATVLAPLAAAHRAHADLLAEAVPSDGGAVATSSAPPSATPSATGSAGPVGADVPTEPARAVAALARGERELALHSKRHAFAAESGAFARILGSMAASAAQHVLVLEGLPGGGRP